MPPTGPLARIAAADFQEQADGVRRVGRVALEIIEGAVQVADERLRPVAFLAGVARRTQVFDRRADRARILVERHGIKLIRAGNFRLHEPRNALADVAFHAGHARVRAEVVRGFFRLHHLVAGFAAERHRLGEIKGVVGADGREQQKHHAASDERHQHAPVTRIVQINLQRRRPAAVRPAAAFQPRARQTTGRCRRSKRPAPRCRSGC